MGLRDKEFDQAVESLERKFFGENLKKVNAQLKLGNKFSEFDDYYYYPILGLYIDQGFPVVLKRLCNELKEEKELTSTDLQNLVSFDDLPTSEIKKYLELCDSVGLFLPEETAYCFINLGISKDSKGILVTSKGLYFSPNCMIEKHFMSYERIDGISEGRDLFYDGKQVAGVDTFLSKKWANLITFIVLFFKYGDIKYTGKIVSSISQDNQQKLDEMGQPAKKLDKKLEQIGMVLGVGFWIVIIILIFRACGGSGKTTKGETFHVTITLNYEEVFLTSNTPMNVYVDDTKIGRQEAGSTVS